MFATSGCQRLDKLKRSGYFLTLESQCEALNRIDQRQQRIIVDGGDPFLVDHGRFALGWGGGMCWGFLAVQQPAPYLQCPMSEGPDMERS